MKHLGILIAASSAIALTGGTLQAKTLTMALDRAGTLFNATGSGIAKVASKHSGHRMIVRAFGGPDSYMSQLNDGKYDFSAISSPTAYFNFNGRTKNKKSTKNIRLIQAGSGALRLSFVVYADSDIKTFADLKGKRVTSDFGGHTVINPMVTYALKSAGLGWKDVRGVPVTGALDAPRALGAGRVDATWASLGMPVVREIHAKKKVRYLSFDKSPATLAMLRKNIFPGVRLVTVPPIKPLQRLDPVPYPARSRRRAVRIDAQQPVVGQGTKTGQPFSGLKLGLPTGHIAQIDHGKGWRQGPCLGPLANRLEQAKAHRVHCARHRQVRLAFEQVGVQEPVQQGQPFGRQQFQSLLAHIKEIIRWRYSTHK